MNRPLAWLAPFLVVSLAGPEACAGMPASESTAPASDPAVTGFEQAKPGRFEKLKTAAGIWTPIDGTTIIDDRHASNGKQCLQLMGGTGTTVILDIAPGADTTGDLIFRAERWTKRPPFSFRIEKKSGGEWIEIYNGDRKIRVGRPFLSQVRLPLRDADIRQLRFSCSSPPETGILIDDLRLTTPVPMQVVSVEAQHIQSPVLVRNRINAVLDVRVEIRGSLNPLTLTGLTALQSGAADTRPPLPVEIWATGTDGTQPSGDMESLRTRASLFDADESARLFFEGEQPLDPGVNHFYLCTHLPEDVDLSETLCLTPGTVTIDGKQFSIESDAEPPVTRFGYALRKANDDGSKSFRIPGLATTNNGTLIAVYDVRRRNGGDLPGDIDVGMSRSSDGGQTWEEMRVIMDMGNDPKWNYDGIGDPAVLVDRNTGTIWVAATWSHGNRSWRGSGPGLEPHETGQLMLVRSDDDGLTWSKPVNITKQVKKPEWCFILQGPGKGITMQDGTLVFAAQYQDPPEKRRLPHSTIIYSRDHGGTWHVGTGAFDDTTEAQVVEVEPGMLMLNCRYNRSSVRVVVTTRDMGRTWQKHPTSERDLIEPRACMASLIRVDQELGRDKGGWLLFSNPDSTSSRSRMMIKASQDGGRTWPKPYRLLLDEGFSAYSCMSMIDEETVGILYEGSRSLLTFQQIPLSDIVVDDSETTSAEHREQSSLRPQGTDTVPTTRQNLTRRAHDRQPNILLIVGEDHGCEVSCYGDPVIRTPNIDGLASQGVLFEKGYVTQSVCSPSRSTIFTGLYPHQNGQLGLATHQYGWFRKWPTTYSLLKTAGYRTGLIGKTHVIPADAVESFVDFRFQPSSNFAKKKVADYAVKAGEFFRQGDDPFFMTVNYPDAHWPLQSEVDGLPTTQVDPRKVRIMPYVGHETPRLREVVRRYYDCMLRLDACIGQLLQELDDSGKADNTLVVFIGDHGAQMARGKVTVYEGGLRVPFLVRWPGVTKPGLRSPALVSTIDLLPTFMDAAGVKTPNGLPGKSLRTALTGTLRENFREYIACERNCDAARHTFPQRTIRDARYKLIWSPVRDREDPAARYYRIHGATHWSGCPTDEELVGATEQIKAGYARWLNPPGFQLYDLQSDPHEWTDLANDPQFDETKRRLLAALQSWQTETNDWLAKPTKLQRLMRENDAVFNAGRRSPKDGWQYLKYLAPPHP